MSSSTVALPRMDQVAVECRAHMIYRKGHETGAYLNALCEAIAELPKELQDVFVYRKVYDCSHDEIATLCDISREAVKSRLSKSFGLVQAKMLRKGITKSD